MSFKRHITLIVVASLCLAGFIVYLFFFLQFQKNSNATRADREHILLLTAQDQDMRIQKKLIETSQEKRDTLTHYFLSEQGVVPFLETIESFGSGVTASTKITAVDVANLTGTGQATPTLNVSLEFVGSYQQVFTFLSKLEHLPYEIQFTKTKFSHIGTDLEAGDASWQLTTTFTVISFIPSII